MPVTFNDQLDDSPVFDAVQDFRGGMNSATLPHLLQPHQYADGLNVELSKGGRLQTRPGFERVAVLTTATSAKVCLFYNVPGDEQLLVAGDADLMSFTNPGTSDVSGYDLTGEVTAFQGVNRAFFAGADKLLEYDGTNLYRTRRITVEITAGGSGYTAATVAVSGGGSPVEELEVEATVNAGAVVQLNITVPGRGYTSAPTLTINGDGTGATATATLVDPPVGNLGVWHTNRGFLAGDEAAPDALYASDILDGAYWSAANSIRVGGDGEAITALFSWDVFNLLVLKENSVYVIPTDPGVSPSAWGVQKVSGALGCVAQKTVAQVGADAWWLSRQGVVSVRRLLQETQREVVDSISVPIQPLIDRINWSAANTSCAAYFNNKYFLSVPLDSATEPNTLLVFDTYHQVWVGYWTGVNVRDMTITKFGGEPSLFVVTDDAKVWEFRPGTESDVENATPIDIPTRVELRAFSFGEPVSPKSLFNVELEFNESTATLDLGMIVDGQDEQVIKAGMATSNALLTLPFTLPATLAPTGHYRRALSLLDEGRMRSVQLVFTTGSGHLAIRSAIMSAFLDTMEVHSE